MSTSLQILLGTDRSPQVARLRSAAVRQYEPLPRLVGGDLVETTVQLLGATGAVEASSGSGDLRLILADGAGATLAAATVYTAAASAWTLDLDLGTVALGDALADGSSISATLLVQQAVSSTDWRTWGRLPAYVYPDSSASYATPTPAADYYTAAQVDAIVDGIETQIAAATADIASVSASLAALSADLYDLTLYAAYTSDATLTSARVHTDSTVAITKGAGNTTTLTVLDPEGSGDGATHRILATGATGGTTVAVADSTGAVASFLSDGQGTLGVDLAWSGSRWLLRGALQPCDDHDAYLIRSRNLADLTDATTARTNLGIVSASTAAAGLVELATDAETQSGASSTLAVTPAGLASVTATTTRAGLVRASTLTERLALTDGVVSYLPGIIDHISSRLRRAPLGLAGWSQTLVGGTVSHNLNASSLDTTTTAGRSAYIRLSPAAIKAGVATTSAINWGKRRIMSFAIVPRSLTTNGIARFGLGNKFALGDPASQWVGIRLNNGVLSALVHDGTTLTATSLGYTTAANETLIIDAHLDGTGGSLWYVNDSLVPVSVSGCPTTDNIGAGFSAEVENGADSASMRVEFVELQFTL